jgi:hypothetical protein
MIGDRGAAGLIALRCSLCSELPKRARLFSFCARPIKPVFLSRSTHDVLRINTSAKIGWIERGIFILRLDVSERHLDCGKFVATDASAQYFIEAGLGIELPLTALVDERNWKGPIIVANEQGLGAIAFHLNGVLGVVGGHKILPNTATGSPELTIGLPSGPNTLRIAFASPDLAAATRASTAASGFPNCSWAKPGALRPKSAAAMTRRPAFITMATPSI